MHQGNKWLVAGGTLSALAAILHIGVIAGGPAWYRFFGAGEAMAQAAERGSPTPALITLAIAAILMVWALYAFSGAGMIRRLPLLRTALVLISGVYLLRALALLPVILLRPELVDTFAVVSSIVVLGYGLAYAIGTWSGWPALTAMRADGHKAAVPIS
jgi:hypothetical protein